MIRHLPILRASSTKRWINCTWFSSQEWPESPAGPEAQAGTRVHNGIAAKCGVPINGDLPRTDREWDLCRAGIEYLADIEQAHPGWTRSIEQTLEWTSISGEDEVVGHADVLLVSPDGTRAIVIDWKTGRMHDGYDEQLATYAWLARFNNPGVTHVTVILAFLADGVEVRRELNPDALHEHSVAMLQAMSRRSEEQALPTPGAWCQWCPGSMQCPKNDGTHQALAKAAPVALDLRKLTTAVTTAEEAAQAHAFVAYATEATALIEANLKAYVREHGPITTAEGQRYAPSKQTRRTVDATPECLDVLQKHGMAHVVEPTTTWNAIKKAAGKDRAKAAAVEQDLVAAGALRVTEFETWTTK